jgi:hypothetical protein
MPYKDPEKRRIASRRYYESNKAKIISQVATRNIVAREGVRAWLYAYLKNNPCVDCGEADPIVLEFDHQRDKLFTLGDVRSQGVSVKTVMAEVAKCEVRCANCHRKKTYIERGYTHKS